MGDALGHRFAVQERNFSLMGAVRSAFKKQDRGVMSYVSTKWRQSSIRQVAEAKTSTPYPYSRSERANHKTHGS